MSWLRPGTQSWGHGTSGGWAVVRECFQVRWVWWIQTPPRWWSSHFHSWLGLCFHHLDQLSQGLTCFLSASWDPQWRVSSIPSVFFFLMTIVVNSLGPFLYLCIILFVPDVTVIPECPCGFSVGLVPWFSVTSHLSSLPDVFLWAVVTLSLRNRLTLVLSVRYIYQTQTLERQIVSQLLHFSFSLTVNASCGHWIKEVESWRESNHNTHCTLGHCRYRSFWKMQVR